MAMAMAMAMASLSLSSSSSPTPPSLFSSFSSPFTHLCRHSPSKSLSPTPSSPSVRQPLLRIVAKQPTRRETVKTRHLRIRKKLSGTPERPRLAVFRSNKHLYAQVIDDTKGCTLASASTLEKERREELQLSSGSTIEAAKRVGTAIAKACLDKGITKVAYDRGGFVYHGRIQALADAARETGLAF